MSLSDGISLLKELISALGWWWALVIAVLVALGYWIHQYQRHQARQRVILLRDVYIHLIQNGPARLPIPQQANRINDNINWWAGEVEKALRGAGASEAQVSQFRSLGIPTQPTYIAAKLDALETIIRSWTS